MRKNITFVGYKNLLYICYVTMHFGYIQKKYTAKQQE